MSRLEEWVSERERRDKAAANNAKVAKEVMAYVEKEAIELWGRGKVRTSGLLVRKTFATVTITIETHCPTTIGTYRKNPFVFESAFDYKPSDHSARIYLDENNGKAVIRALKGMCRERGIAFSSDFQESYRPGKPFASFDVPVDDVQSLGEDLESIRRDIEEAERAQQEAERAQQEAERARRRAKAEPFAAILRGRRHDVVEKLADAIVQGQAPNRAHYVEYSLTGKGLYGYASGDDSDYRVLAFSEIGLEPIEYGWEVEALADAVLERLAEIGSPEWTTTSREPSLGQPFSVHFKKNVRKEPPSRNLSSW